MDPPDPREAAVDHLLAFQRARLAKLLAERARIGAALDAAAARAARAADALSAARALVAARAAGSALDVAPPRPAGGGGGCGGGGGAGGGAAVPGEGGQRAGAAPPPPPSGAGVRATPVGVVYSGFRKRFEAPRQSFVGGHGAATVVLQVGALARGVGVGDRLVLVFWLDRNAGHWREFVRPPRRRAGAGRVGVFATRSPNRPTPAGLSLCVVRAVDAAGQVLRVAGVDVLDETPLLSARPYDPAADYFPSAAAGWLDDPAAVQPLYYDPGALAFDVRIADEAAPRIDFIDRRSVIDIPAMLLRALARGQPAQHGMMPVGAFRVLYKREGKVVTVVDVKSGMRDAVCEAEASVDPEALLHNDFKKTFPREKA